MNDQVKKLCLVILFLSVFSLSYAASLNNPGFESDEEGWYNWNDQAASGTVTSEYKHSGEKSVCRVVEGLGQGGYGQAVPVNPGETIKLSAWIMSPQAKALSSGGEAYIRIEFWNSSGPLESGHKESEHIKGATDWKKLEVVAKAPAEATEARVLAFARGTDGSKGEACFDDFEMTIEK